MGSGKFLFPGSPLHQYLLLLVSEPLRHTMFAPAPKKTYVYATATNVRKQILATLLGYRRHADGRS